MAVQVLTYDGLKYTVDLIQDRIYGVACDIASSATTLNDSLKELSCRVDELERAFQRYQLILQNFKTPSDRCQTPQPKTQIKKVI